MGNTSRIATYFARVCPNVLRKRRRKIAVKEMQASNRRSLMLQPLEPRCMMAADMLSSDPLALLQRVNSEAAIAGLTSIAPRFSNASTAEGLGELAEVKAQILDANGVTLLPVLVSGVQEYTINAGEKFSIRTTARDLRGEAKGVFSVYNDVNYVTEGNPSNELIKVLWSEVQTLRFTKETNGGTFTLAYGSETTVPITFSRSESITRNTIANAIGGLSFVGGASNVRVTSIGSNSEDGPTFDVFFVGGLSRQNLQDPVVGSNNLTSTGGDIPQIQISSVADPVSKLSLSAAISYPANSNSNTFRYDGGSSNATLQFSNLVGFRLNDIGGFYGPATVPQLDDPSEFVNVYDTSFEAANSAGFVDLSIGSSLSTHFGIGLFEADVILSDSLVLFPSSIRIRIVEHALAVNDSLVVVEDSLSNFLDVTSNDSLGSATSVNITATTPLAFGSGSISIASDGKNILYSPSSDFTGTTSFTYTISDSFGASSTATVSLNVTAVNDGPITDDYSTTVAEDSTTSIGATLVLSGDKPGPATAIDERMQVLSIVGIARTSTSGGTIVPVFSGLNITSFTYTPAPNFVGSDSFTYTLSDNDPISPRTSTGTVSITVTLANDEIAEVQAQVLNAYGKVVVPTIVSGVPEYRVTTGSQFSIRTRARDLRSVGSGGVGIFAAFADLNYATLGDPNLELAQVRWGEVLSLQFSKGTNGGTFTLNFGNEATSPIPFSTILSSTNDAIATAVGALAFVGGVTNVRVASIQESAVDGPQYTVSFTGKLARTDVVNGVLGNNNLTLTSGGTPQVTVSSSSDPSNKAVFSAAISYPQNAIFGTNNVFRYNGGGVFSGRQQSLAAQGYRLDDVGNFANVTQEPSASAANQLVDLYDANFLTTSQTGLVDFTLGSTENSRLGVAFFGDQAFLSDRFVTYPAPFRIRIDQAILSAAANDSHSVMEDSLSNVLSVSANDLLGDAATFAITSITQPTSTGGIVSVNAGGLSVTYKPSSDFAGQTTFTYTLTDDVGHISTATVSLQVNAVNDPPVPNAFTGSGTEDSTITINAATVLVGDLPGPLTAVDEQSQTVAITGIARTTANGGTITPFFTGSKITSFDYKPRSNFAGIDTFTYTLTDNAPSTPLSAIGTITLSLLAVNDPPIPDGYFGTATEGTFVTINSASILLGDLAGPANEPDEQGQVVTIINVSLTTASGAGISLVRSGGVVEAIDYTPPPNFAGIDTFTYTISDNFGSNPLTSVGTITINVIGVNDPPEFSSGPDVEVIEDGPAYSERWVPLNAPPSTTPAIVAGPSDAVDEIDGSQTVQFEVITTNPSLFSQAPAIDTAGILTFKAAPNSNGIVTVSVTAVDSGSGVSPSVNRSSTTTFTITITPVNDDPIGIVDSYTTNEDTAITNPIIKLTANDSDPDGDAFGVIQGTVISARSVSVSLKPDGTFSYDPSSVASIQALQTGQTLVDTFAYQIRDAMGAESPLITVSITVEGRNAAPVAVADTAKVLVSSSVVLNVLSNDTDEEGVATINTSSVSIVAQPSTGTAAVQSDGTIRFTPTVGFRGAATFQYTIADDQQAVSPPALVTINVVDSFYQNPRNRFDVNDDGQVSPVDVLQIINFMKRGGIRDLPPDDFTPPPFIDVDGSRSVEPIDVLQVINFLARQSRGLNAEGEGGHPSATESSNRIHSSASIPSLASVSDFTTSSQNRKRQQQTDSVFASDLDQILGQ